jgi:uncharacterized DUF497 family protein
MTIKSRNITKHDVAFDTAKSIWGDEKSIEYYDFLHSLGEDRFVRIGHSSKGQLLKVVFTEREQGIRIISARNATTSERKKYEEGI